MVGPLIKVTIAIRGLAGRIGAPVEEVLLRSTKSGSTSGFFVAGLASTHGLSMCGLTGLREPVRSAQRREIDPAFARRRSVTGG